MFSIFLGRCGLLAMSKGLCSVVLFCVVEEGVGVVRGESGCLGGRCVGVVGIGSGKIRSSFAIFARI